MRSLSAHDLFTEADRRGQRAVPCIDVAGGNADIIEAICTRLATAGVCAFLSSTPASIDAYLGLEHFRESIELARRRHGVYAAPHLDHAEDPYDVERALETGIRSVMFDGSLLAFSQNVARTRSIVARAHAMGASVEAELGAIGGKEDPGEPTVARNVDPGEAVRFLERATPDLFAPAIGTVHGRRGAEAHIDWELVDRLVADLGGVPLVLHGTTGLPDDHVRRLVALGFRKVNYATVIRDAFVSGVAEALSGDGAAPRPQELLAGGRQAVAAAVDRILEVVAMR